MLIVRHRAPSDGDRPERHWTVIFDLEPRGAAVRLTVTHETTGSLCQVTKPLRANQQITISGTLHIDNEYLAYEVRKADPNAGYVVILHGGGASTSLLPKLRRLEQTLSPSTSPATDRVPERSPSSR
ncbi:hypothetical protein ACWIGW_45895 [Nocardia brasiliensis]